VDEPVNTAEHASNRRLSGGHVPLGTGRFFSFAQPSALHLAFALFPTRIETGFRI
jgi:hypothetical protein